MPIAGEIDERRDLVVLRASGTVTKQDALNVINSTTAATKGLAIAKDVLFLLDERASLHQIDLAAILGIKENIEGWLKIYPRADIKCALVASGANHKPVAELWRAVTDAYPSLHAHTKVLSSEAAALTWLKH